MGTGRIYILLLCIFLYFQVTLQSKCRRTNKKPYRYCLNRECKRDNDCRNNERCLCDGDCGLSCVRNGTNCGNLETSKFVRTRLSAGTQFGSVARFSCREKQKTLRGSKKRVCRGIGKWDGRGAKCRVLCRNPGDITFGNKNSDKRHYRVGDTIRYWCFPGYDIEGESLIECNNKGKWNPSPPKCSVPTCAKPTPPDNSYSTRKLKVKYRYNEVVMFRCDHGYYASGSAFRRCLSNGWSNSLFRCIPKSCGDPGSPLNGKRKNYVFTFKRRVYFECDRGYKLHGPEYRQCQANQRWSDRTPTCEPIDCGRLDTPENGEKIEETTTTYKGRVVFQCKKVGFELKGSRQRTCEENGWSGTNTTCERVECKDLGILGNGVRRPEQMKYVYEDRIDFRCKTNHTMRGNTFIICQSDRTWTGTVPYCSAPCTDPGIPVGGQRYQHSFLHNSVVQFRCNLGWSRDGSHTIRCDDGRWDYNPPTCNKGCSKPTDYPTNGGIYDPTRYYSHKTSIRYYCGRGYNLFGQENVRCLNGTWENRQPTCRPVECRDPGRLFNGGKYPEQNKYVFKDSIRFQCKTNYTIRGDRSITCQHNKRWSGNVPTCLAPCRDPGIPNNGRRLDHSFLHNAGVKFSCQRGWNIDGFQTIRCDNGNWDHQTPQCLEGCQRPKRPDNGGIYSEKDFYKHRQQIRYYCSNGYQRLGDEYSTCQNGKWTGQTPTCKQRCGDPGRPANGYVIGSTYYEGREVSFDCYRGYDLIGSRIARCLTTGQWSQPRPVCKRGCYTPQFANSIPNPSLRRGQKSLHGTSITFTCRQQSHTLDGPSVIYCLNGQWRGRVPSCRAPCSKPSDLAYGRITGQNYGHGKKITFTCLGLYTLVGSSSITCNDGRWALDYLNQWPSCRNSCPNPGIPIKGSRSGSDYRHGKRISYTCEKGTQMIGESFSTCNDGKWSSVRPSCLKICQDPGNIINGFKTETRRVYLSGDKATYRCNHGFDLAGRAELRCDDDGSWDHEVPVCYSQCKVPSDFTGVQSQPYVNPNESLKHKKRLRFSCAEGKLLAGTKKTACNNGTWSKPFPTCQVPCKDLGPIENGRKTSTNFTAKFKCDTGYSLEGPAIIKCVEGKWIPGPSQCLRDCDDPEQPRNGMKNSTDFKHGKSVAFGCLNGFRLIGSTAITCSNGSWSSRTPRCKGVCPFLDAPQNGKRLGDNFDLGARVNFECDKGYSMDGPSILICNRNRNWSGNPPICKAPCSDPGYPRNGRRKGDNFVHRSAVEFFCDQEYEIFGAQNIRCNDGNWSHPVPACETGCLNLVIPKELTTSGNIGRSGSLISFSCTSPLTSLIGKSVLTCTNGRWSDSLPKCIECGSPLGMAIDGRIPDGNIQASSTRLRYRARDGRLNGPYAWCSGTAGSPYLQVDFGKAYRITGLATQGSAYDNKWVERYTVSSNLAGSSFNMYREDNRDKIFDGNRDKGSTVKNKLRKPLIARRLRIHPQKDGGFSILSPACMRVEIYGCDLPSDCIAVGSRIVAKWVKHQKRHDIYFKAYLTDIGFFWKVELENENHGSPAQKYVAKYTDLPFVLDVPPKHEELRVGTRVLALWWYRWYTGTIKAGRNRYNKYLVMADDGDQKEFTIEEMRLLKAPVFC